MKVDPIRSLRTGSVRRGEPARGTGESFAAQLSEEPSESPASAATTMTGVEALLGLQEVAEDTRRRPGAKAQGNAVLDQLEQVRLGLLLGFVPRERLEHLSRLADGLRGQTADPRLAEILGEIELRAKVELAKLAVES